MFTASSLMNCRGTERTRDFDVTDTTDINISFERPVLDRVSEQVKSFHVEYGCSRENPRTVVVDLSWESDEPLFNRQRLDVTVYKDGFDKGYYVSLGMGDPSRGLLHARPDIGINTQPYAQTLALQTDSLQMQSENGKVQLQLSELNSQTNYFWRVLTLEEEGWIPSKTIRKSSPTCIYDMSEGEEDRF